MLTLGSVPPLAGRSPDVSVVIPTRNRWGFLERAVAVALGQENVDLEVVVVLDGSSDESATRLAQIADQRIRVVALDSRVGVARARNIGAENSASPWLSFLDDDDLWAPDRTRRMLDASESVDLVAAGIVLLADDEPAGFMVPPPGPDLLPTVLTSNALGGPSNVLVRRDAFRQVGGFDPRFAVLADWDLWIRVLDGRSGATIADPLNAYVMHGGGMHRTETARAVREFGLLRAEHGGLAAREGTSFDEAEFGRWIAESHRGAGRRLRALRYYSANALRLRRSEDFRMIAATFAGDRLRRRRRIRLGLEPATPEWVRRWI